jgi:peptidoglycan/LPS O-acetylase OafA/YrhL
MNNKQYFKGFDVIRPIAAFSVIWIHGCGGSYWMRLLNPLNEYAVPVFIAISMFLFTRQMTGPKHLTFREVLITRFQRLMIPFFLWTFIYLLIRYVKSRYLHDPMETNWPSTLLFKGSSYQLWFLPNLFYLGLLFYVLLKYARQYVQQTTIILTAIIIIAGIILYNTPPDIRQAHWLLRHTILYFVPSLISASTGMLYYLHYERLRDVYGNTVKVGMAVLCIGMFIAQLLIPHVLISLLFVAVLLPVLLFQCNIEYPFMQQLSKNAMGIYLVHGVVLEGIKTGMQLSGRPLQGLLLTLGAVIITYVVSYFISDILSRFAVLRKYLMGN